MKSILFSLGFVFFYVSLFSWPAKTAQVTNRNNDKAHLKKLLNILTKQKKFQPNEDEFKASDQDPMDALKQADSILNNTSDKNVGTENNEDLFAYLFKIESKPEYMDGSDKNVLFSSASSLNGTQSQHFDSDRLMPKVNTKVLAKLFEILNKNFLDGANNLNLAHKTHEFYDNFYKTLIQELELVEDENLNELNTDESIELLPNTVPATSTTTTTTTTKKSTSTTATNPISSKLPFKVKKLYRLKRIKNIRDLLNHFRRNQDEIDYGTILYVG